ncbi:uncharacterized protein [Panulirus ornatus]|uniref:uncharacterized protein n=1 Tax=Panulirus ornatus TaxID=150431 RepID=UPI003A839CD6
MTGEADMAFKEFCLESWKRKNLRTEDKNLEFEVRKYRREECQENRYEERGVWDDMNVECWQEKENFPSVLTRSKSKMIADMKMENRECLISSGSKVRSQEPGGALPSSARKMDRQMIKPASNSKNNYFDKFYGIRSVSQDEKKAGIEKVRHIFERARERRRTAILNSGSKISPGKLTPGRILTPLKISQKSHERTGNPLSKGQQARKFMGTLLSGDSKNSQKLNDADVSSVEHADPSKKCCRELMFESEDEGDSQDDHTAPLNVMDISGMISGASILKVPHQEQQQQKWNLQPYIKENLFSFSGTNSLMKKTYNLRYKQNKSDESQSNVNSKPEKKFAFKIYSQDIHGQSSQEDIPMNTSMPPKTKDVNHGEVIEFEKKDCDGRYVNVDSSKKVRFGKEQKSARKIVKRRSAIIPCIRMPMYRTPTQNSNVKGTSRIPKPNGVHSLVKKPLRRRSQASTRQHVFSTTTSTCVNQNIDIPKIVVSSLKGTETEDQDEKENVIICKADKCDASTNTTIKFVCGQSPSKQLSTEIENLVREQDQINGKAELLLAQTCSRRQQMKDSGIMESFITSVSPLRRLQTLLKEREECSASYHVPSTSHKLENSSANESFLSCEASVFRGTYCTPDNINASCLSPNTNVEESSCMNTAVELNVSQSQWNQLKQDSRSFQTPSTVPVKRFKTQMSTQAEDEEDFLFGSEPKDKSPFTELVGDCERPSLAPMTPHSRQQVSQLKLCLKKQLEQLYD